MYRRHGPTEQISIGYTAANADRMQWVMSNHRLSQRGYPRSPDNTLHPSSSRPGRDAQLCVLGKVCSYHRQKQSTLSLGQSARWTDVVTPILYGAVTTGDTWKFGVFRREVKEIQKDLNTYAVPSDLTQILSISFGVTMGAADEAGG